MKTLDDFQKALFTTSEMPIPRVQAKDVATFLMSCPFGKVPFWEVLISLQSICESRLAFKGLKVEEELVSLKIFRCW